MNTEFDNMYGKAKVSPAASNKGCIDAERWPYHAMFVKFCETTTAHGFRWCLRLKSRMARRTLIAVLFLLAAQAPYSLMNNFVTWATETTVNDNMVFKTAKRIRYPNITVCNRKYFSKRRLNGKNRAKLSRSIQSLEPPVTKAKTAN